MLRLTQQIRLTMSRKMERIILLNKLRRLGMVVACTPLVLLAGCPQNQAAAPSKVPVSATAPALGNAASASAKQAIRPATPPAQTAESAAKARKVQQLINRAEQAYHSGVDSYRAGHLDAARMNFDAAVDLILTSGIDVKSDPQLSDEFEHLVDAVNSLEMAALKQGNGFSPTLEAAPLDAANEVTFPPYKLSQRARGRVQRLRRHADRSVHPARFHRPR